MTDGTAYVWRVRLNSGDAFHVVAEDPVEAAKLSIECEALRDCAVHSIERVGRCVAVQTGLFAGG